VLVRRLTKAGYGVITAANGADAVATAGERRPDLVLMDMNLPVMDGFTATRLLKATEATRGIPVVALTALVMPGDRAECLQAGSDEYDGKPVDFPSLLSKIKALIP